MARIAVTGTRGVAALLGATGNRGLDAKTAIEVGLLHAEKVEGVWAYSNDGAAVETAREAMTRAVNDVCSEWLLVPTPIAIGGARKLITTVDIDYGVARALVRSLIRVGLVGSLPLLTDDYQPYFAIYSISDQDEIDLYIAELRAWAEQGGEFGLQDLPKPRRKRTIEAWRERVLRHGEYLGLGRYEDGSYVAHGLVR